jgi:PhnB protein
MAKQVKAIPDGYHSLTPYFTVRGADKAIEFYKRAFGAEQTVRMDGPDGRVMHAEVRFGDSVLMLGEEQPGMEGQAAPQTLGGVHAGVMIYCDNVDQWVERAVKAGATVKQPPMDMFWGDRFARIADPFGYLWSVATHQKDLTPAEVQKGQVEFFKQMAAQGNK